MGEKRGKKNIDEINTTKQTTKIFISDILSKKIYNKLSPLNNFENVNTSKFVIKSLIILLVMFFGGTKAVFGLFLAYLLFNLIDIWITEKKLNLNDIELKELKFYRKLYIISSFVVILVLIILKIR